jgi:hypothetical protein
MGFPSKTGAHYRLHSPSRGSLMGWSVAKESAERWFGGAARSQSAALQKRHSTLFFHSMFLELWT